MIEVRGSCNDFQNTETSIFFFKLFLKVLETDEGEERREGVWY